MRTKRLITPIFLLIFLFSYYLSNAQDRFPGHIGGDEFYPSKYREKGPSSLNIKRVGAWPYGPAEAVAVDAQRDLIFLGSGGVVLILDGQDKTNPQLISESLHTAGLVKDLCYDSTTQRLYVAAGEGGMEIWDVQDPAAPVRMVNFEVLYFGYETPVEHIGIYGNYAIVACSWGFVHSIDVSDPANPVQISFNGTMGNPANDLFVSPDGQAHTTGYDAYVRLAIQPNGNLNTSGYMEFLYGAGAVYGDANYAYVGYAGYLYILSFTSAIPISATNVNGIGDIVVKNNRAYITNSSGLQIWDLTNPNSPSFVGQTSVPDYGEKLAVAKGYAYIARYDEGLSIVEIGDGTSPVAVGSYDVFNITFDAFISGNYAYLAHVDDGMLVIDLSDSANPTLIGQYDTPDYTYDVYVSGDYAYVADLTGGLRIADISDPSNPTEIGVLDSVTVFKLTVSGNYAYIVTYQDPNDPYRWIRVVDVSDPANPDLMGALQVPGRVSELAVSNSYLFVAADDDGIRVIDVSNPSAPTEVSVFTAPSVFDICIQGNYAYFAAADWDGGFGILNISDPTNPALVSLYNPTGWFHPFDVTVVGTYAWLGNPVGDSFHLFDISERTNPIELDSYTPPGGLYDLFAVDSLVYVSDGAAGLQIFENLLYSVPGGNVSWQSQISGTSNILQSVYFADQNNGWVVGEAGTILNTVDGGQNWQLQNSGTSNDLNSVYFTDTSTGWVVGDGGIIIKTIDSGASWNLQTSGTTEFLSSIHFINATTGWVVGDYGLILKTVDGGSNWQLQNSGTNYGLLSVDFVDANHGWCAGGSYGMIFKTADGGSNWQTISTGSQNLLISLDFVNANVGWAVGTFGEIQKTTDGGNTWQNQTGVFPPDWLYSVCFLDENTGWTVGFDGKVQKTEDGGTTWTLQTSGTPYQLNSVYFVDELHGWSVGENGTIIKYALGITSIGDNEITNNQPKDFILYDNYPNPFNPVTNIQFDMPRTARVVLKIYDMLGREVKTLVDEVQSPGQKSVIWDGTDHSGNLVSSGIYLYRLQSGEFTESKKMILMK